MLRFRWSVLFLMMVLMTGCLGMPRQPSPEELAAQQQIMQMIMAKRQNQQPGVQQTNVINTQPTVISEADLLQKINAFPAINKRVAFIKKQGGLEVNGGKLLDPEGAIKFYGFDAQNGDVTYLVKTGADSFAYKYVRATGRCQVSCRLCLDC